MPRPSTSDAAANKPDRETKATAAYIKAKYPTVVPVFNGTQVTDFSTILTMSNLRILDSASPTVKAQYIQARRANFPKQKKAR
jgi:hypothetical protein